MNKRAVVKSLTDWAAKIPTTKSVISTETSGTFFIVNNSRNDFKHQRSLICTLKERYCTPARFPFGSLGVSPIRSHPYGLATSFP